MITAPSLQSLEDQLAAGMRRSLLPHPFAPRRDLEIAGAVRERDSTSGLFDAFWPSDGRLALVAARVHRGGVGGALRAACLRGLARDALALDLGPDAAVDLLGDVFGREFPGDTVDLLLATLHTASGRLAQARIGRGSVVRAATSSETVAWLVCGDASIDPEHLPEPAADMGAAAGRVATLSGPGSAVLGFLHRRRKRATSERTFSMSNDIAAISRLTARVEAALAEAGAPESVGAAFGLALDELLTNVVSYGFVDGARHEILVDLAIEDGAAEVRLRDDGRPFNPLRLPSPDLNSDIEEREVGGLGVHFVRQSMDLVEYARETGWNVLRLRKGFVRD